MRREAIMTKCVVKDILCNTVAQLQGHISSIEIHGVSPTEILTMARLLYHTLSELRTVADACATEWVGADVEEDEV